MLANVLKGIARKDSARERTLKNTEPKESGRSWYFHLHTLWLFTVSDHKAIVYPMTTTGLLNFLAGPTLNEHALDRPVLVTLMARLPLVIFWVWFNILVFCLGNQRRQDSVEEDALNKPWRPIPSKRMTQLQADRLFYALHVAVIALGIYVRTTPFTLALLLLGWMYNDWEGGSHPLARNTINACAVVCFALGATAVAHRDRPFILNQKGQQWQWIIAAVVCTTLHISDFHDQEGDRYRGRSTIPILIGDVAARWTVVTPMLMWSWFVPSFWNMSIVGYLAPLGIGCLISWRSLIRKGVESDRATYKMWGLWIAVILALPSTAP
jgi:4-hydroxybenzoate polyprenyltransferase